ncbi:MAG: CBS domain-containing protein [Anaerolineales bacterium]|nr:CBS domain-containing protein [Anaerolineales bacterium]
MKQPVITVSPETSVPDALALMHKEKIRRTPVVKGGKLVGIVSEKDLLNASPSPATSLSIWEMNYLLSKLAVSEVMTTNVYTVTEDTPIEEAARIMADYKVGGLPVVRDGAVVGIITETDLFKILLEMMGAREAGVRVSALVHEERGQIAKLSQAIASAKGNIVAFGQFAGTDPSNRLVTFKIAGLKKEELKSLIQPMVIEITDLRDCP